jgi:uncharacterized protein (TIGR03032 family)
MTDRRSKTTGAAIGQASQAGKPAEHGGGQAQNPPKIDYSMSAGLVRRLAQMRVSLAFTSYQSGILYMLGRNAKGGAQLHQSAMPKPMGLHYDPSGRLTLTAGFQIMRFENVLGSHERINGLFDACFVPRMIHMTGQLDAHDVGLDTHGNPVFVNTRYNCLAAPDPRHSFRPLWRPPFITDLVDEDRCHLNGLAVQDGVPAYVTAVSRSNTIDGWRDRRADGGVIVDVRSNEIVCEGLSMPHSPRMHRGELWVLNSGTGELGVISGLSSGMGRFEPRVFCPGFLRGLSFHGDFAFVGLSKPRYKRFEGLALDDRLRAADSEAWCGVQIIDLSRGTCVDWFRIDGAVGELYDVEVLPNITCPMAVSPLAPDLVGLITFEGRNPASGSATAGSFDGAMPSPGDAVPV